MTLHLNISQSVSKKILSFIESLKKQGEEVEIIDDSICPLGESDISKCLKYQSESSLHMINSVIDNVNNLIFYKDINFNYLGCNIAFEEFMGHSRNELVGHDDFDFFPKELAEHFRALDQKIFNDGKAVINPQWVTYPDGRRVYLHTTTTPFYDMDGKIMGLVGNSVNITNEKILSDQLEHQAQYDYLTGIPNRALFMDRLDQVTKKAIRHKSKFAVLFIDLDNFKPVNDLFGHQYGDIVLKIIAQRLNDSVRESDTVARLGGDEFAIIIDDVNDEKDVELLAEKLIDVVDKTIIVEEQNLNVTLSIGISFYNNEDLSTNEILSFADNAMYKAKAKGRNCYIVASPDDI